MKNRIKVLQLHPDYNVRSNDVSDLAEQIIKGLPTDQFEVTSAYISGEPRADQPRSLAEHVHYFNIPDSQMRGMRLGVLWKVYRFCKARQFDVVICNRFKIVSLMLQLNRLLRIPLCIGISHVLNEYNRPYRRWQVKWLADKRWQFVGVSAAVRNYLINYRSGFSEHNTHAISNAIDIRKAEVSQLDRMTARSRLGLPLDKRIIGAIGVLTPRKGHHYLISALANIKDVFPDAHIAIIGKGPNQAALEEQIQNSGLEGRVHLLGFRDNGLQYVKAFDIFAMPSLKEGLPLALMEGISGHLPVIASDIPEMHDMIVGAGGIAVLPKDVTGLANALSEYLSLDQQSLQAKGEQAFHYLVQHHSIEDYRQHYYQLITQHLASTSRK